jgi:iron complex outermembrane receptor protein
LIRFLPAFGLLATLLAAAPAAAEEDLLEDLELPKALKERGTVPSGLRPLLDTVVVTATKQTQTIAAAPAIISVITDEQIKRWGYRTVAEVLERLPGLYLITDHVNHNLGIRGINGGMRAGSRIVKLMIDGQPVSFRPSTENWLGQELIPIEAVARIEVIRGPSSALYGANAFLGVINIITKGGAAGVNLSGTTGVVAGHPAGGGSVVAGIQRGTLEFLLSGTVGYADRSGLVVREVPNQDFYADAPYNAARNDTSYPASVFAKILYGSPTLGSLSLDLSYQRLHATGEFLDWGVLTQGEQTPPFEPDRRNVISLQNLYVRGRSVTGLFPGLQLALSAAFVTMGPTNQDHLAITDEGVGDFFTRDVGTTGLDFVSEFVYTLRDINNITFGVDVTADWQRLQTYYSHSKKQLGSFIGTEIAPTDYSELGTEAFHNVGTYLQSVFYPFSLLRTGKPEVLGLTVNLRYDRNSIYGDVVNYRLGGVFFMERLFNAKLLYGTSFRAPAPNQLFTTRLGVGVGSVRGNPDLKPESARTIELLLATDVVPGLAADLSAFYTVVDDKVEFVPDKLQMSNVIAANVTSSSSVGFDVDLHLRRGELAAYLNLSYQLSKVRKVDNITYEEILQDSELYPTLMTKFGASYRLPKLHLGLAAEGRFISSRISSDQNSKSHDPIGFSPYELDPYFLLDLSVSSVGLSLFHGKETFLQAKVYNLTNQDYAFPGFKDYDVPALGTTFMFTLSQQL